MFQVNDVIKLKKPISTPNVSVGDEGTILIIYDEPNLPRAYEVEFLDNGGNTIALVTVTDDEIESIL